MTLEEAWLEIEHAMDDHEAELGGDYVQRRHRLALAIHAYAQAAVDAFKADTLGMRSSLSQMVFWAICYQQDSKESTFMDAGHKKWIAREIAGAEALLGKEKKG